LSYQLEFAAKIHKTGQPENGKTVKNIKPLKNKLAIS